jgi:hypothetical protein
MRYIDTALLCKKIRSCKKGLGGFPEKDGKVWIGGQYFFEVKGEDVDKTGLRGEYDFDEDLFDASCLQEEKKEVVVTQEFKISSHIPKLKKNNVKHINKYRQYLAERKAESKAVK